MHHQHTLCTIAGARREAPSVDTLPQFRAPADRALLRGDIMTHRSAPPFPAGAYDAWKTDAGRAPQGCAYCADTGHCPACKGSGIETDDSGGALIDERCERCNGTGLCDECVEV